MTTMITKFDDNLKQLLEYLNMEHEYRLFNFHHIGIASKNIEEDVENYQLIGYKKEDGYIDKSFGIKAQFLIHPKNPRLEILQNLPGKNSLDIYLNNFIKIFHTGYLVDDFEYCYNFLINKIKAKAVSDIKVSSYFKSKSCYIFMPDGFIIEIVKCL